MDRETKNLVAALTLIAMGGGLACSASPVKEDEFGGGEELPAETASAATDEVPADAPAELASEPQPPAEVPAATDAALADPVVAEAPVAAPTQSASAGTGEYERYTVSEGDSLMKIAFEQYGDLYRWKDIYELNKDTIKSPSAIPKGTVLKIEKQSQPVQISRNGEKYFIKTGDTLGSISGDVYGTRTKWRKLWENNKELIKDPNKIFAGFYLYYVPEAGSKLGGSESEAKDVSRAPTSDAPVTPDGG